MESLLEILKDVDFWMALSIVAAALPGPQTRLLPNLFKAVAQGLAKYAASRKTNQG